MKIINYSLIADQNRAFSDVMTIRTPSDINDDKISHNMATRYEM